MILISFNHIIKGKNLFLENEDKNSKDGIKSKDQPMKGSKIIFSIESTLDTEKKLNIEFYKNYESELNYIFSFYKKISEL